MANRCVWFLACLAVVYAARIQHNLDEEDGSAIEHVSRLEIGEGIEEERRTETGEGVEEVSRLDTWEAEHPNIYLNVMVSGVADATLSDVKGGSAVKNFVSGISQKKVTRGILATQVAREMPQRVPESLAELGIEAEAKQVFLRGTFTVIRLTILRANLTQLLTSRGEEARAQRANSILGWLHSVARWFGYEEELDDAVTGAVNRKVAGEMCARLSEQLPPKIAEERGVDVNVTAVLEADEAKYFFDFIESLPPDSQVRSITEKYGGKIATAAKARRERNQAAEEEQDSEEATSPNRKRMVKDVLSKWRGTR